MAEIEDVSIQVSKSTPLKQNKNDRLIAKLEVCLGCNGAHLSETFNFN